MMSARPTGVTQFVCTILFVVGFLACPETSTAQSMMDKGPLATYGQLHGTWFNGKFIEELSTSHSLGNAISRLSADEPLWIRIDSTVENGRVQAGMGLSRTDTMLLMQMMVPRAGLNWGLGYIEQPSWMLSYDSQKGTYIALTPLDSLETAPIVMGKLPSKNPDPQFMLRRMVNASVLSGSWKSASGQKVSIANDQTLTINGDRIPYQLTFDKGGERIRITSTTGQPRSWTVDRKGSVLTLTPSTGQPLVLTPERRD